MVFSSWTNMVTYIFFYAILMYKISPLNWRNNKRNKRWAKSWACTKPVTRGCKLSPSKGRLEEYFEAMSFKFVWFSHKLWIKLFYKLETFSSSFFFKCYFKNPCFQLQQNVLWTDEMTRVIIAMQCRHKWGKFCLLYLLNKHSNPSFFYCIFRDRHWLRLFKES